jgi:cytochrome c553
VVRAKLLKRALVAAAGLVAALIVVAIALYVIGGARLGRSYHIDVAAVAVPNDEATVARGRHLAEAVTLCTACHGDNLEGGVIFDEPGIATIYASNLTRGLGGTGSLYSDTDYVRAIRHGVSAEGRGLMIMHSDAYNRLGEADLGAIIAYLRTVPPADNEVPKTGAGALGRIMLPLGLFDTEAMPLIAAEAIDHSAPLPAVPERGTVELAGQSIPVIGPSDLIASKRMTGREQDLADLADLERSG